MKNNFFQYQNQKSDRFIFPFLVGALTGGAAVGLTRPRPIYNVAPVSSRPMGPYGYSTYSYYYPGGYNPYYR